jgi:threonine synthase
MFGFQAAGAAPIVEGHPIEHPHTVASAIRIGNPASWQGATNALKESNGHIDKVTDEEILAAYQLIARTEGIFAEPASTAPLAGLIKCVKTGMIPPKSVISVTLTGHGLKDPDTAIKSAGFEPFITAPEKSAVMKIIGI